jgi:hypothetical protein
MRILQLADIAHAGQVTTKLWEISISVLQSAPDNDRCICYHCCIAQKMYMQRLVAAVKKGVWNSQLPNQRADGVPTRVPNLLLHG